MTSKRQLAKKYQAFVLGGRQNSPRKVAMYLAQKRGGYRLSEITAAFGLSHYGGVSNAIHAITEMLKVDRKLGKKINAITNRFDP